MNPDPPLDWPDYRSSALRAPHRAPVPLPLGRTELTGPVFGESDLGPTDADLTRQHPGEPLGERIVVHGRVVDTGGRPLPHTLVIAPGGKVLYRKTGPMEPLEVKRAIVGYLGRTY